MISRAWLSFSSARLSDDASRMMGVLRASWRGFTLIEVVVALVIVLVLAAVALPSLDGYLQQKRVDETFEQLTTVAEALYDPAKGSTAFSQTIGANAGRLSELSSPILSGNAAYNTGTDNSCGAAFTGGEAGKWNGVGPFVPFFISRDSGMVTPIGKVRDSITRIPNSASNGSLRLSFVDNVALEDAVLMDSTVNSGDGSTSGSIQWTAPVAGVVTMYFFIPINNRC